MTIVNTKSLLNSIRYAWRGLRYAFSNEQNFRIQCFFAVVVLAGIFILDVERKDIIILLLIIATVLILELINSVFEYFLNVIEPKIHVHAKVIKDVMAASVLLMSVFAIILGILIFWPYIAQYV